KLQHQRKGLQVLRGRVTGRVADIHGTGINLPEAGRTERVALHRTDRRLSAEIIDRDAREEHRNCLVPRGLATPCVEAVEVDENGFVRWTHPRVPPIKTRASWTRATASRSGRRNPERTKSALLFFVATASLGQDPPCRKPRHAA